MAARCQTLLFYASPIATYSPLCCAMRSGHRFTSNPVIRSIVSLLRADLRYRLSFSMRPPCHFTLDHECHFEDSLSVSPNFRVDSIKRCSPGGN